MASLKLKIPQRYGMFWRFESFEAIMDFDYAFPIFTERTAARKITSRFMQSTMAADEVFNPSPQLHLPKRGTIS